MDSMYNYLNKPNQCPWCFKSYARKAILEFHFNSTHSNMFNLFYQKFKTLIYVNMIIVHIYQQNLQNIMPMILKEE